MISQEMWMRLLHVGTTSEVESYLEREQVFRRLFEHSADAMLLLDGTRFIACNQAAVDMLGYTDKAQLINTHPADLSPEFQPDGQRSSEKTDAFIAMAMETGSLRFEWIHRRLDGTLVPVEVLLTAMPLNEHVILHVVWRDISDRVHAHQALEQRVLERTRESNQRRQIAQGMHDILTILNSNRPLAEMLDYLVLHAGRLLESQAVAIYQLQPDAGQLHIQAAQGLHPDQATLIIPVGDAITGRAVAERRSIMVEDTAVFMAHQGDISNPARGLLEQFCAVLSLPLLVKDAVYGALTAYYLQPHRFTDEEIRLAASFGDHAALAIENARLRAQIEQNAIAAERSRLARDLHDSVTQTLFSASLIADVLPRLWARNPAEGQRRLEEVRQLTRGALAEMRTLLIELRPATLLEVELPYLLRQLIEAISARGHVPVDLRIEGVDKPHPRLPTAVHVALYRIAQEALNNIARHAHARNAEVVLRYQGLATGQVDAAPVGVTLEIQDDGRGFDPQAVSPNHLGLAMMRERAHEIAAHLAITSAPGQGTRVAVAWHADGTPVA